MFIFTYMVGGGQLIMEMAIFHLSDGCCQGKSTKQISLATGPNIAKFTPKTTCMGFITTKSVTNLSVSSNEVC